LEEGEDGRMKKRKKVTDGKKRRMKIVEIVESIPIRRRRSERGKGRRGKEEGGGG
jgi:hypothetical protein